MERDMRSEFITYLDNLFPVTFVVTDMYEEMFHDERNDVVSTHPVKNRVDSHQLECFFLSHGDGKE
jgi:hypothetical protein